MSKCLRGSLCLLVMLLPMVANTETLAERYGNPLFPAIEDGTGVYAYQAMAKRDYSGKILRILVHEKPNMGEPVELHARQFAALTGAEVKLTHVPFGQLYPSLLWGLRNGWYDVVFYGSLWLPDTYTYLHPMLETMQASKQFQDVIPYHQSIASWNNRVYQVPIDGDRHYFQFRRDVYENESLRANYLKAFGKALRPPKTWKEVTEQARFFHGRKIDGQVLSGLVEITKMEDLMFSNFIKRAAPYAKHPDVKGGFYFDLQTMEPQINNPGFVEALKDFVDAQVLYPPGGQEFGLADVNRTFAEGAAVFTDNWDDSFIYAMQTDTPLYNRVAASLSPGARKVWNRRLQRWDDFPEVNYAPYIAWGWTSAVAASSPHPQMAFDYLGFFGNQANHDSDLLVGRFGVNPFRKADLRNEFWRKQAGWDKRVVDDYIKTFNDQAAINNRVYDLRIHKVGLYMKALSIGVKRALTGRSDPQQALDDVANKWRELNLSIGVDKQRQAYANIVRLEDGGG